MTNTGRTLAVLALATSAIALPTTAHAADPDPARITFHSVSKEVLDDDKASGRVQIWTFNTLTNQIWEVEQVASNTVAPLFRFANAV
ncbi:hypothetical protein [Streptomyces sp. WAC07149]|uniref:hypothetical protein n=1 Tax=Streptomyces sp. WAC07149 TaxID=2487425 RepID=UPI00163C4632|nr:hypothetical protein [Streptomyces sp. WAC07149]